LLEIVTLKRDGKKSGTEVNNVTEPVDFSRKIKSKVVYLRIRLIIHFKRLIECLQIKN